MKFNSQLKKKIIYVCVCVYVCVCMCVCVYLELGPKICILRLL